MWRYSGILSQHGGAVVCTGLDFVAVRSLIDQDADLDMDLVTACLRAIEAGRLRGQAKLAEQSDTSEREA